jgi:5-methylthioadenosine/S-adenosylhomocysteine deaminase
VVRAARLDLLIQNGTVVTLNADRQVLVGADVLVEDGRIARIGKGLSGTGRRLREVIDARGATVLPGLIHGHLHACQTLFRNHADGLELLEWLRQRIWPMEAAHDAASMRASADLTFAELISSGATAALDMGTVRHTDQIFASAQEAGFRLTGGKVMMDAGEGVPPGLKETTADSLAQSLDLAKRWHGAAQGRLRYAFCPRFVLSCTEELLREVGRLARELDLRIHTHASENPQECALVRARTGQDNVRYFHALGLTGPQTTLAHCVWLTAEERALLAQTQTVVCHCPGSNLKLASGVAELPELLEAGVPVALGADGAPCNNNLDIFTEMRLAALIHKPRRGPLAVPATAVLEMATLGGARALGLEKELGSIEVGKRADLVVLDLGGAHTTPAGADLAAQIVYSARASDVRDVAIDGRVVLRQRRLITLDLDQVRAEAARQAKRLARAVG